MPIETQSVDAAALFGVWHATWDLRRLRYECTEQSDDFPDIAECTSDEKIFDTPDVFRMWQATWSVCRMQI